jgi:hypothetical protein
VGHASYDPPATGEGTEVGVGEGPPVGVGEGPLVTDGEGVAGPVGEGGGVGAVTVVGVDGGTVPTRRRR